MVGTADERSTTRLGRILVEKRWISEQQLDAAIREQGHSGRRLGEILADMKLITQAQVRGAMRRQRNLRLAAGLATALLGPLQAYAAAAAPASSASPVVDARPFGDGASQAVDGGALDRIVAGPASAMPRDETAERLARADDVRMQTMDDANALAVFQHAVATAQTIQQGTRGLPAGVHVAGDLAKLFDPRDPGSRTLSVDIHVSQVSVDPGTAYATVGKDGAVTLRVQSSAGDISVRNLRVDGLAGADTGRVNVRDVDARAATVSIKAR